MPSQRIIMIDIDGVLHEARKALLVGDVIRNPEQLRKKVAQHGLFCHTHHLASLLAEFGDVVLVVHSDWRHFVDLPLLREFMGPLAPYVVDVTSGPLRHHSITEFVKQNNVAHYRILDDAVREFPFRCPELIACHPMVGVSDPNIISRMRQFHKPDDEKRMVVILPESSYDAWLRAPAALSNSFVIAYPAEGLRVAGPGGAGFADSLFCD